ncbi:hypothetical protein HN419_06140 [Candidatus Woesearchaeota archaeon]|jgi:hypothetical protein|nr:hypothetical protein [Candidatus Woesearchaeota archaeon]MBT3538076.1 hypothetical protein [Candidatus Woesearchaeota archaeon]MBT7105745.1 hypothetical protein [Candidatus Woesearchaeota archaeon]MBT7930760.1 hypothetical protein [Candidatus Woesearchaeota archaeon]
MDDLYAEIMGSRAGYGALRSSLGAVTERLAGDLPEADLLRRYEPRSEWFSREESRRGVHGIPHEARVLVLSEVLSRLEVLAGASLDQDVVRWSAVTHDLRRHGEGFDYQHGERSAAWVMDTDFGTNGTDKDAIAYCNFWHVPQDCEAPSIPPELRVLKDADAVDRFRAQEIILNAEGFAKPPTMDDVFDHNFLRTNYAHLLVPVGRFFYRLSAYIKAKSRSNGELSGFDSVLEAGRVLGLVR